MNEVINVILRLSRIRCNDEGDGWGSAEPYLWVVFFKIDGESVFQNGVRLAGEADFKFSRGSHRNLPNHDVDDGETVQIPVAVGEWRTTLRPIEIDDFQGNTIKVPGLAGIVAVLMEEDNVSGDGAEAGHQALNNHIQTAINRFIAEINLLEFMNSDDPAKDIQERIDELTASIKKDIRGVISDAIRSNQNWLEDLWAGLNKDDKIGDVVWTFNATEIMENNNNIGLSERWKNEGDWEIFGNISIIGSSLTLPSPPSIYECNEIERKLNIARKILATYQAELVVAPTPEKRLIIMIIRQTKNEVNALKTQYQKFGCR